MKILCAAIVLCTVARAQAQLKPSVANFIEQFSYAATQVDLTLDEHGVYPHLDSLGKTVLELAKADDETVSQAFKLLDKNQSTQRLVVGDLFLILIYDIPPTTDWKKPASLELRNLLVSPASDVPTDATWPWQDKGNGLWNLRPFKVQAASVDKRLSDRLAMFKARFQRRKFSTDLTYTGAT